MTIENWEAVPEAMPAGPYDVSEHPFSGRWEIWTEHAGVIARCDNESDARGIVAALDANKDSADHNTLSARLAAAEAERGRALRWAKRWKRAAKQWRGFANGCVDMNRRFVIAQRELRIDRDSLRARAERAEAALHRIAVQYQLVSNDDGFDIWYCHACGDEWPKEVGEDDCAFCIARAYFQEPPARAGEVTG